MLAALQLADAELSVFLTDDELIRMLNRDHRNKDRATDVLAFALEEPSAASPPSPATESERLLGDVVISLDTALRQARARRRPLLEEVRFLLAHGLLHLCGYDHMTPADKREMDNLTRRLVRAASRK